MNYSHICTCITKPDAECAAHAPGVESEPDRSGWPVLVADGSGFYVWDAERTLLAIAEDAPDKFRAYTRGCGFMGYYPTARAAADALRARLPDDVPTPADVAADVRRALEGAALANAPLRDALATLRAGLRDALSLPDADDNALIAAARVRATDTVLLDAGLALLDARAETDPGLRAVAVVIRRALTL